MFRVSCNHVTEELDPWQSQSPQQPLSPCPSVGMLPSLATEEKNGKIAFTFFMSDPYQVLVVDMTRASVYDYIQSSFTLKWIRM